MDEDDRRLEYYMSIGAVELAGMDEEGEIIFAITEKAKEIAPELWEAHEKHIDEGLLELYSRGLIEIEYDENLEASMRISEEGKRLAKEFGIIPMDPFDTPNN